MTCPQPDFLTLPPELRQHIYSYLLINNHVASLRRNYCSRDLSLACRQLYLEILYYYYDKNTFCLSLPGPERFASQLAAYPQTKAVYLQQLKLSKVQHLQLEMKYLFEGRCISLEDKQLEWFCGAIMQAKQGLGETILLKNLELVRQGDMFIKRSSLYTSMDSDEDVARCVTRLRPLRGKIGKLTVFWREVAFMDEDEEGEQDSKVGEIDEITGRS